MSETTNAPTAPVTLVSACAAAVDHCIDAYQKAYRACLAKGGTNSEACCAGKEAYRLALPRTDTVVEIRALVACVAHGIMFGAFYRDEPNQLLSAARVALATRRRPKGSKRKNNTPM